MTATKLPPTRRTFDFPALWQKTLILSGVIVLASVIALIIGGLNLGIDFEGGTSFEVRTEATVDEVSNVLPGAVASESILQEVLAEDGTRGVRVRTPLDNADEVETLRASLNELGEITALESVGPTFGSAITEKAIRALIVFFIGIAIYISIRLEWKMAIGALAAVAHDIVISVGAYAIFRFEVTPATVIAFLTIMGYSLYDTIVVYDKVRDITARVGATGRYTYTEMMNLALNQVLARSINTTITSIIPVLSMLIVGSLILGATTLQEFSIALLVGLIVGGYSSLFIASFVVALLKEREPEYEQIANKVAKKTGDDEGGTRIVDVDDVTGGDGSKRKAKVGASSGAKSKPGGAKSAKADDSGDEKSETTSTSTGSVPPKPKKSNKTGSTSAAGSGNVPPKPRKTKRKR